MMGMVHLAPHHRAHHLDLVHVGPAASRRRPKSERAHYLVGEIGTVAFEALERVPPPISETDP